MWCASSGSHIDTLRGHSQLVHALKFIDSGRLASAGYDGRIKVWRVDAIRGGSLLRTFDAVKEMKYVSRLETITDDHSRLVLVSASDHGQLRVWNVASGRCLSVTSAHDDSITDLAAAGEGSFLASASIDSGVKLWRVNTLSSGSVEQVKSLGSRGAYALSYVGRGLLAVGYSDGHIRLWHWPSAMCLRTFSPFTGGGGSKHIIVCLRSLNAHRVAIGSDDKTVRIWHTDTDEVSVLPTFAAGTVEAMAYDEASGLLVGASNDKQLRFWNVSRVSQVLSSFHAHNDSITSVEISPLPEPSPSPTTTTTTRKVSINDFFSR